MIRNHAKRLLLSLLPAGMLAVLGDFLLALLGRPLTPVLFLLLFFALAAGLFCCKAVSCRVLGRLFAVLFVSLVLLALLVFAQLSLFSRRGVYAQTDADRESLFAGRHVMVFAPHPDDELSMLAGTLEEYVRYGSTVRIVFTTNGDLENQAEQRIGEALSVADMLGIPRENLIFLGYGDGWYIKDGLHLYNAPADWVCQSHAGRTETYGSAGKAPFREGRAYTRQNFYEDLRDVLLTYHPDVIFTTAYEPHGDHRAAALFLEEALAEILAAEADYAPLLLESVSYHTSYFGAEDFYSENAKAIPNPFAEAYNTDTHIFNWADRLRLPVRAGSLSRSVLSSSTYQGLSLHKSQGCNLRSESIISADTVFWQRDTASLSYRSRITVSSGDARYLHNFKLLDSSNINSEEKPFEDLWLPEHGDREKTAWVELPAAAALTEIRLYDNPSLTDNVINARITLDNGQSMETGPLAENGSATVFPLEGAPVKSFTVTLLETEGERAGLTELEAYESLPDYGLAYVKLQNEAGDFVYDYYIDPDGEEWFTLFVNGEAPALDSGSYSLSCASDGSCSASFTEGGILVSCPKGKHCTVSLRSEDGRFVDTVEISNPGSWQRSFGQRFESFCLDSYYYGLRHSGSYTLLLELWRALR